MSREPAVRPAIENPDSAVVLVATVATGGRERQSALADEHSISRATPGDSVPGVAAEEPTPFQLYRVVRGSAVEDPAPVPASFPVAFFTSVDHAAARQWLDGLLESEERTEGEDRSYPGAIAAYLHISVDGTSILSFSEWVSEEEAVAHIEAVWEPVLKEFGGTGARYRHHRSLVSAPAR